MSFSPGKLRGPQHLRSRPAGSPDLAKGLSGDFVPMPGVVKRPHLSGAARARGELEQHAAVSVGTERRVQIDQINRRLADLPAQNRQVVAAIQMVAHGRVVSLGASGPQHVRGMVPETLTPAPFHGGRLPYRHGAALGDWPAYKNQYKEHPQP